MSEPNPEDPQPRPPFPPPPEAPDHAEEVMGDRLADMIPAVDDLRPHVVGLGGSAGALGPLKTFLGAMPADTGMAFVVVTHLSPDHESLMAEILQHSTSMPVVQVSAKVRLERDHVYVIPPSKHLILMEENLGLADVDRETGRRVAVDMFFRTLADTHGPRSVGIVLSGGDGDGALGIKRIKERGGLTIVQDPEEAEQDGMPRSAIATGMADWVLPVAEMPGRIMEYFNREKSLGLPPEDGPARALAPGAEAGGRGEEDKEEEREGALRGVLSFLRTRTGRDFTCYKRATILRRIARRMQVNGLLEMADYLAFLRTHPGEPGALLQDLLISVTNFFRDRDAFAALEEQVPALFAGKRAGDQVRVWAAGCATGEEAYSVAILLMEYADTLDSAPSIQVFATDLDGNALNQARAGLYTEAIAADVSEERLRRFFLREGGRLRVRTEVRERVLFAVHDLFRDAPFSRLDLITCRNLFIYVNREMQQGAMEVFHFALRPGGRLFLGSAESTDAVPGLFTVTSKKHRLYSRTVAGARQGSSLGEGLRPYYPPLVPAGSPALPAVSVLSRPERPAPDPRDRTEGTFDVPARSRAAGFSGAELHLRLLRKVFPPSVVIDADGEIIHLSGPVGRWLAFSDGEPSRNLLRLVNPGLRGDLRTALLHAAQNPEVTVEVGEVPVEFEDGVPGCVRLRVSAAGALAQGYFLVTFSEDEPRGQAPVVEIPSVQAGGDDWITRHLEEELEQTRRRLRDTEEQHRASIEEMKAGNEELQAMNEELRSAGEELVTSREELQSVNEELQAVNQELKNRVEELSQTNSDLQNLMAATDIATVFLDRDLRIKRYTPTAVALFSFIPGDLGRPLFDLTPRLDYRGIDSDARHVLESLSPVEREVRSGDRWFLARLQPYRTVDDHIAGVVLTFVDITARREAERAVQADLEAVRMLGELSSRVISPSEIHEFYEDVNAAAMRLTGAEGGALRLYDSRARELALLAAHGFPGDFQARFDRVNASSVTPCGAALASGARAVVDFDDPAAEDPKGDVHWHLEAGYLSAQSTPLLARSGRLIGMISTHWRARRRRLTERESRHLDLLARQTADLIERHLAFEDVQSARADAVAAGLAKDHFLAVLSHELRTPLTPVLMGLEEILGDEPGLSDPSRGTLEMCVRNVELEVRLIDDLLDVTRISRGKLEIRSEPVRLHEVIRKALELCSPDLKAGKHAVTLRLEAGEPLLAGDDVRLQQVFWNLLKNAAKFTPEGGKIVISSRLIPGWVEVEVEDNGPGWRPEVESRLFEPFTQADKAVTRKFGGLGLGLAISRALVTAHRGTLDGHSRGAGQGAVFKVCLPLESASPSPAME